MMIVDLCEMSNQGAKVGSEMVATAICTAKSVVVCCRVASRVVLPWDQGGIVSPLHPAPDSWVDGRLRSWPCGTLGIALAHWDCTQEVMCE